MKTTRHLLENRIHEIVESIQFMQHCNDVCDCSNISLNLKLDDEDSIYIRGKSTEVSIDSIDGYLGHFSWVNEFEDKFGDYYDKYKISHRKITELFSEVNINKIISSLELIESNLKNEN